jgi:N-acyl homoserine lactone hydrolase
VVPLLEEIRVRYEVLLNGFPGRTERGFLGWSTAILILGEGSPILFDTGGGGDRRLLLHRLRECGLAPDDIRTVVLSHLHFDHVGNAECFPHAEIVVHENELSYVEQHGTLDPAVPMFLVWGLRGCGRLKSISGEPSLSRGVSLIQTPGHTGGHCSIVLETPQDVVVLAQDAIKHRGECLVGRPAEAFAMEAAIASIDRIVSTANVIVPGHDCPLRLNKGTIEPLTRISETLIVTLTNRAFMIEP